MPDQIQMVETTLRTLKNLTGKWNVNLWTNNKLLLPKTQTWAQGLGIELRDLSELPSFSNHFTLFN